VTETEKKKIGERKKKIAASVIWMDSRTVAKNKRPQSVNEEKGTGDQKNKSRGER